LCLSNLRLFNLISSLPIDDLARVAQNQLMQSLTDGKKFVSVETVASKIKLIAARTQHLFPIPESSNKIDAPKVDIFSNTNSKFMWRWELVSLDFLPDKCKSTVKKARAERRKLKNHQKAVVKLIQAINDVIACIKSMSADTKKQRLVAKLSIEEEKVLKYEREEEKIRLLNDAKKQKESEKQRLAEEKRMEKESLEEAKRVEKAQKLEEKESKKKDALEGKERKKKEASTIMKEEQVKKQKSSLLSFFKSPSPNKTKPVEKSTVRAPVTSKDANTSSFDSKQFWSVLGSGNADTRPFASSLSSKAVRSKKRKVRTVNVRVFTTGVSDNPFDQQVYDQERTIPIRNRYKYLIFREDFRPAYHGTWSKKSSLITARNPVAKDTTYLDYDVDSEAEWEEGDDDQGEDCSENGNDDEEMIDDEEGDATKYNYEDGWLAEDCDIEIEGGDEDDEESKELRKRKVRFDDESTEAGRSAKFTAACVIAPLKGGIPQASMCPKLVPELIEGIDINGAEDLLSAHYCQTLVLQQICRDPFAPVARSVAKKTEPATQKPPSPGMSREDLITFAKFVHNATLKSKEIVVEELRNTHKDITSSRAQATRKLDSIATKRRLKNGGGVIWEVKNEILESLGLHELVKQAVPEDEVKKTATGKSTDGQASKSSKSAQPGATQTKATVKGSTTAKKAKKPVQLDATKANATAKGKEGKASKSKKVVSAKTTQASISTTPDKSETPALVSPKSMTASPSLKRKSPPPVSKASVNLLQSFLKKKKTSASLP